MMKNYFLYVTCLIFLFACGKSEDSILHEEIKLLNAQIIMLESKIAKLEAEAAKPKVDDKETLGRKYLQTFSQDWSKKCPSMLDDDPNMANMLNMLGVDWDGDVCNCMLDAGFKGETYESLADESAANIRVGEKIEKSFEICLAKFM